MRERGDLRPDGNPAELAVAVMTSLQGGLLLTQTRKSTQPLQIALQAAFTYVRSFASQPAASERVSGDTPDPAPEPTH